ncbi:hypothetical protein AC579_7581 [Pseudocercospora musae]|uniref:C3H1-type domain-containing protein n=1 Tax=Pseudocercospora musae TaxID=113226 RepID=A0A139I1X2_9PEZI|nr:hypothetical protein AC579_7581 [Pseudocercospora musae]
MLSELQLEEAASQLRSFQVESEAHLKSHVDILQKYGQLMEDYKRLRSDYEEERDSREKYKQLAKGQERNPFVLVLVDGDGMIFDDDLVSSGADGGTRAAQLLHDVVRTSLRTRGLEHCKVMVRVYANLAGLSKALSKSKLAGPEKRSLTPFVANFNRSNELFDFVDAGELKENADFKIRAMFRQFADNAQCKHIFFAACHDVGYISELTPYMSSRDRITLVRGSGFHPEFVKLGLRVEDFPHLFRTTPLTFEAGTFIKTVISPPPPAQPSNLNSGPSDNGRVCGFYQKGSCRYGNTCKNLHIKAGNGNALPDQVSSPNKYHMSNLTRSDNNFMNGNRPSESAQSMADFTQLPKEVDLPSNRVPVNKDQHRLDPYLELAIKEERAAFQARTMRKKLCNSFHLTGECPSGDYCNYDHSPIDQGMLNCIKSVARNLPCQRKGACRIATCFLGHVCQKEECRHRGGKTYCKLPSTAHNIDLKCAEYLPAIQGVRGIENETDEGRLSPPHESESGEEGAALSTERW